MQAMKRREVDRQRNRQTTADWNNAEYLLLGKYYSLAYISQVNFPLCLSFQGWHSTVSKSAWRRFFIVKINMDVFVVPFSSWSRVNQLEFSSDQGFPRYDPIQHLRQCRVTDIFIDLLAKRLGWNHWSLKRVQNDVYCVNFDLYLENAKAMKKRKTFLLSFVFRF